MNYNLILVRYGEIALKGKEVRKRFEDVLVSNIKSAFNSFNLACKIEKQRGRIFIHTTKINEGTKILKKIFGIISVSPAFKTTSDIKSISKLSLDICKQNIDKNKSFAIRTTRTGEHGFSSQDVSIKIGADIVKELGAKVDLTKPDFELFIEIRNERGFIFTEKISCAGGMPQGSQGNILSIIDSNSSILAAWYLLKRGCRITFLINDESIEPPLKNFIKNWFVKSNLFKKEPEDDFYDFIGTIINENNFDAIVTDNTIYDAPESIFEELKKLKKHTDLPILHPIISMTEEDINKKCKKIGLPV